MLFPGNRNPQHYFPVEKRSLNRKIAAPATNDRSYFIVGLDQLIVDIEVLCDHDMLDRFGITHGESVIVDQKQFETIREYITANNQIRSVAAGGAVANTLNNFVFLSGEMAYLLGAIDNNIKPGSFAFRYLNDTPRAVDVTHCVGRPGHIASSIVFITPDGERSFALNIGIANDFPSTSVPKELVKNASAVLLTAYCLRAPNTPIYEAAYHLMELCLQYNVPLVFSAGTSQLVQKQKDEIIHVLKKYTTVAAMNMDEATALTGEKEALLASKKILDWTDIVVVTEGKHGLTMAGYTDEQYKRPTKAKIRSKEIPEYNKYEYSRLIKKSLCTNPIQVYSHIHPYLGGPEKIINTNGAGDAAVAALLHDFCANDYHRDKMPESEKHRADFITYSSLARNAQYGNRLAYQVLLSSNPRLDGPLFDDEASAVEGEENT